MLSFREYLEEKRKKLGDPPAHRSADAKSLEHPQFHQRVVKSKKVYDRKKKSFRYD